MNQRRAAESSRMSIYLELSRFGKEDDRALGWGIPVEHRGEFEATSIFDLNPAE
jgi:hypothetical protein